MSEPNHTLSRQLRLWDATAIYVGIILGSGIFFAPSQVAAAAPSLAGGLALWVFGGAIAACGAFCYAESGARLPRDGGFFVFYREAYGDGLAFIAGWVALLVTYPSSMAVIALILGRYLTEAVGLGGHTELASVGAAAALLLAGLLNLAGIKTSAWSQRLLTAIKVGMIVLLCAAALLVGGGDGVGAAGPVAAASPETGVDFRLWLMALVGVLWTYSGWSDVTLVSGELRDPARNLGRTVFIGTAVLVALYALVQVAVSVLLPAGEAATSQQVLSDAIGAAFGTDAGRLVAVLVVISTFGAINGNVLVVSRLGYAMARGGMAPAFLARVHGRFGTPVLAIATILLATLCYVASNDFRSLLGFFTFSVWIFYALAAVGVLILRHRRVGEPLSWRAPLGILPPLVVMMTALFTTVSLLIDPGQRRLALAGAGLLLAALPAYLLWRRFGRGSG